ncbi:MAG: DUF87 domain-containing protein [Candidatus Nitrosopolaris sp.]
MRRLRIAELNEFLGRTGSFPIKVDRTRGESEDFEIYAEDLDGKSHLSRILIKTIVQHGAFVIVFDLNDEYGGITTNYDGSPSSLAKQVRILQCGKGLSFSLAYCGKAAISNVLKNALDTPAASMREFFRIWDWLENRNNIEIEALGHAINTWNINELVRDALVSRLHVMQASRLFLQNPADEIRFENIFSNKNKGTVIVVSMGKIIPLVRRMIVELVLNKLVDLLEKDMIPPIFMFAEEAHLYIRETYWEDIITDCLRFPD